MPSSSCDVKGAWPSHGGLRVKLESAPAVAGKKRLCYNSKEKVEVASSDSSPHCKHLSTVAFGLNASLSEGRKEKAGSLPE
ncbi:UNVERIFIED_CONTAM: hypothetical protein K2H54_056714 [Gekko kuhli]